MLYLSDLKKGDNAKIIKLTGGKDFTSQIRTMGLKEGSRIRVVAKEPLGGPFVIKSHNTTLTIGRGKAGKIQVEK